MFTSFTVGENEYRFHDADQFGGHLTELVFSNPHGGTLYLGNFSDLAMAMQYVNHHIDHIENMKNTWKVA